ncbi:hypothetical protein GCM10023097_29130 [Streptomyces collinus]
MSIPERVPRQAAEQKSAAGLPAAVLASNGGRMSRDGAPRLKLTVIKDDARGPRLCRGGGGPLMPSAKAAAVFCEDACRSRHWRRMRRARARTEAVKTSVTASCPQCGVGWTVGVDRLVTAVHCSPACRNRA